MEVSNSKESKFRESHRGRTEAIQNKTASRRLRAQQINTFCEAVRAHLLDLNLRLEEKTAVLNDNNNNNSNGSGGSNDFALTKANEKQRILDLELSLLEDDLKKLRKHCLSTSQHEYCVTATSTTPASDDNGSNKNDETTRGSAVLVVPAPPEELPLSDIRLLHAQFTKFQSKLDQTRKDMLPKRKFVFRRYRQALQELEQQQQQTFDGNDGGKNHSKDSSRAVQAVSPEQSTDASSNTSQSSSRNEKTASVGDNVVEDVNNSFLTMTKDGTVQIRPLSNNDWNVSDTDKVAINSDNKDSSTTSDGATSCVVLRNISNSLVDIFAPCTAIHLLDIQHSRIEIHCPVPGAIHVTNCNRTTLQSQSQQLRLHDSEELQCHVLVSAGVILEDCSRIKFFLKEQQSPRLDVKDFNWLKAGVPSPHFSFEKREDGPVISNALITKAPAGLEASHESPIKSTQDLKIAPEQPPADDDDDEDEL